MDDLSAPIARARATRRRMDPAARRAHLLGCALGVFARRGLGRGTHAEVAREAGVAVPTVFAYFPTRQALVDAVLSEVDRVLMDLSEAAHAGAPDARLALIRHAGAFARALRDEPDIVRVWLDWSTAVRDDVWPRYLDFLDRVRRLTARTIARDRDAGRIPADVDPADAALIFIGEAHMVALLHFSGASPERIDQFFARAIDGALGLAHRP